MLPQLQRLNPAGRQPSKTEGDAMSQGLGGLKLFDHLLAPDQRHSKANAKYWNRTRSQSPATSSHRRSSTEGSSSQGLDEQSVASSMTSSPSMTKEEFEALPPTIRRKVSNGVFLFHDLTLLFPFLHSFVFFFQALEPCHVVGELKKLQCKVALFLHQITFSQQSWDVSTHTHTLADGMSQCDLEEEAERIKSRNSHGVEAGQCVERHEGRRKKQPLPGKLRP